MNKLTVAVGSCGSANNRDITVRNDSIMLKGGDLVGTKRARQRGANGGCGLLNSNALEQRYNTLSPYTMPSRSRSRHRSPSPYSRKERHSRRSPSPRYRRHRDRSQDSSPRRFRNDDRSRERRSPPRRSGRYYRSFDDEENIDGHPRMPGETYME